MNEREEGRGTLFESPLGSGSSHVQHGGGGGGLQP